MNACNLLLLESLPLVLLLPPSVFTSVLSAHRVTHWTVLDCHFSADVLHPLNATTKPSLPHHCPISV